MHYCDIFRATSSLFISCYTYFGEIFCQTHFLRHLFSHLFCETSADMEKTHFWIQNNEKGNTQPLFFSAESVWLCSAFKKSALRAHTVAIEAKKHNTRFKQESTVFPFPFPVWFWFCSYSLLIWENWRQDSSLATIYKQVRFCVSLSCLVLVMCSAHTSSIWQDSSHTYNNLDSIIIARLWLSCAF